MSLEGMHVISKDVRATKPLSEEKRLINISVPGFEPVTAKITAVAETPEHLKPYAKLSDEQFASLLKAYRKAYDDHADKNDPGASKNGPFGMTPSYSSPGAGLEESPYATSPLSHPRNRNRATFVQRWKVLRERNKNLPKLDFNAKANGIPKKFQAASSFSRSYTYDSMKLPSISTCSVVTGMSGKSVQSDGYRRRDKTTLHEQSVNSDSLTDLSTIGNFQEISANLSKSLQSLDDHNSSVEKGGNSSHRYERITYQKHLSNRRRSSKVGLEKEATVLYKEKTMVGSNTQSKKQSAPKDSVDKQYMYVKNHKKDRQKFPNILHTLKQDKENSKKEGSHGYYSLKPYPTSTKLNPGSTNVTEPFTMTPDDVTIKSPPATYRFSSPKPPAIIHSPAHQVNIALYDADLIAC